MSKKQFGNTYKLNYVMTFQFNCFMYMFFLMFLLVHICHIKSIYNASYNKLAFNINIIYFEDLNNNYKKIKSVEFEDLNNLNMLVKYLGYYYNHLFYNPNISGSQITNAIYHLKISGFINQIKHHLVKIKKTQYSWLHISTNLYVKRITILNYKELKIPKHLLKNYFNQNLGLPKNYQQLNSSIQKIYTWYKVRGFNHVKINLIQNHNHSLLINIQEGVITKTELNYQSVLKVTKDYLSFIENRILKDLSILPGSIINTKKMEIGMKQLKEAGLISYCKYKIISSDKELKVMLAYDIPENNTHCIYGKYINLYQMNIGKIYYSLQKNKYLHIVFKYINYAINLLSFNQINYSTILHNFQFLESNNLYTREIHKDLALKYSKIYNCNSTYQNINFNIKTLYKYPIFDVFISLPDIRVIDHAFRYLLLYFYNDINYKKTIYPIKIKYFRSLYDFNQYNYNTQVKSRHTGIRFQHRLFNYTYINKDIDFTCHNFDKEIIHMKRQYCYDTLLGHEIEFQKLFKNLQETIKQKLFKLGIIIKYNNFQLSHNIQQGTSFFLGFDSITYLPFKKLHILSISNYFSQYLNIEYKKIIMTPRLMFFIKKPYRDALIISAKLYSPINTVNFFNHKMNNSIKLNHNANKTFFYSAPYCLPSSLYLYNAEYHMLFKPYYSLYLFYKQENNLNQPIINSLYDQLYIHLSEILNTYETNTGYGIQFNIPVQNIPPLRIEYCISNTVKNFFQIRLYSKHIKIN